MLPRLLFVYCFSLLSGQLLAQGSESIWLDFNLHANVNDRLQLYGDVGYRSILRDDSESRWNIRPSVLYRLNDRWMLRGGVGVFYEFRDLYTNRVELRPFQGVQYNIDPTDNLRLNILGRVEERMSFDDISDDFVQFELRFRLRLSGQYELLNPLGDNYWFFPFSIELFRSVEERLTELSRDRVRFYLGVGYNLDEMWRITFLTNFEVDGRALDPNASVNNLLFQLKVRREIQWDKK